MRNFGRSIGSKGWMGFRRTVLRRLGYDLGWRFLRAMLSEVVALLGYGVLALQSYLGTGLCGLVAPL